MVELLLFPEGEGMQSWATTLSEVNFGCTGAHSVGGCRQELSGYKGAWSLTPQIFDNAFFKVGQP
jgi:hypothetical protein